MAGTAVSRALVAECIGTFLLVFLGTGAAVTLAGQPEAAALIAAVFGATVWLMVGLLGPVSGAHINPAVSLAFWRAGHISARRLLAYVAVQCLGAVLASALLAALLPIGSGLGGTQPNVGLAALLIIEFLISFGLMSTILLVVYVPARSSWWAGIAIGGWVGVTALICGPLTGASMNPARSLGPALISGEWAWLPVYIIIPALGALAAISACRQLCRLNGRQRLPGCCQPCAA